MHVTTPKWNELVTEVRLSRLLIVYKKSFFELYVYEHRKRRFQTLKARHIPHDCTYRGQLHQVCNYTLVLSVGEDGTLLQVARY